jgi:hypothetical protein
MRATNHSSREWGLARHNDRDFDIEKADHIDPGKQDENYYWNYYGDQELTFQQAELRFYEEAFQGMLQDINARAIASRHKERCKDAIDLLKGRTTCPEEIIYQIGDKDTHVGRNELAAVFNDFRKWHREKFGQHIIPLDYSLHMDEQTPHIHLRQVWTYQNPAGFRAIGQERALKEMGYELPDPNKKEGRNNNRKMVYTRECREKWLEICREKGIEVEAVPEHRAPNKQNLQKGEYIIQKQEDAFAKINEILKERERLVEKNRALINEQGEILTNFRAANRAAESELAQKQAAVAQLDQEIAEKQGNIEQQEQELAAQSGKLQKFQELVLQIRQREAYRDALETDIADLKNAVDVLAGKFDGELSKMEFQPVGKNDNLYGLAKTHGLMARYHDGTMRRVGYIEEGYRFEYDIAPAIRKDWERGECELGLVREEPQARVPQKLLHELIAVRNQEEPVSEELQKLIQQQGSVRKALKKRKKYQK